MTSNFIISLEHFIQLELTVLQGESISDTAHRKEKKALRVCASRTEKGWETEFHDIPVDY